MNIDTATLRVQSSSGTYPVFITDLAATSSWSELGSFVLCDRYFRALAERLGLPFIEVEGNESQKSLEAAAPLILEARRRGVRRDTKIVAIGGGAIQDVATFFASIYMRGLPWTYVPTTLMAMADSCIGGKSSINVGGYKNLVGTFHPPSAVVIDPAFLSTVSTSDLACGLSEAAKICFARGGDAFDRYLALALPALAEGATGEATKALLEHVLRSKLWFIEVDEFDAKERRLLNFGHTWGHALEACTDYAIPHGLAVLVGMVAAISFAGPAAGDAAPRLKEHSTLLLERLVPVRKKLTFEPGRFREVFEADKKHTKDAYRLIVPSAAGTLGVEEIALSRDDSTLTRVTTALEQALEDVW